MAGEDETAPSDYWRMARSMYSIERGDYPEIDEEHIVFPSEVFVAWAVCGNACGRAEFILDGSTQICHYCGGMMFRTATRKYHVETDAS